MNNNDVAEFEQIYIKITRKGADALLEWLRKTDFFTAPCSTRYHLSCEGGLVRHSVNVYNRLREQVALNPSKQYSDETLVIVALLHDICKANSYVTEMRNVKNENGKWEQQPYFAFKEQFAYGGHGAKSVYLISYFMRLMPDEAVAIQNHMGAFDKSPGDYSLSEAYKQCGLALMLHTADMYATYFDESEKE